MCIDYKKELFFTEPKQGESFNVCWWGTYIPLHGLENLIKAFAYINNKKIKLFLFGDSHEKAAPYLDLITKLDLNEKIIINNNYSFMNGKLAPFLSKNCALAIGNFGSSEKARTVLVNKLVDALSLGIPCLSMRTLATTELFQNDEGLLFADPDPADIARQIEEFFYDRDMLAAIGEAGKLKYLNLFSPDSFKMRLLNLLEE